MEIRKKINQARKKLLKNERNFSPCNKCDVNGLLNGKMNLKGLGKTFF